MTTTPNGPTSSVSEFIEQPETGVPAVSDAEARLDDLSYDLEGAEFELDPAAAELPDLSDEHWPAPPDSPFGQDVEGLGGIGPDVPEFVRPRAEALAILIGYIRDGRSVDVGMCLRETRQYFNVFAKYAGAKDSLAGAISLGVAHRVPFTAEGVKAIPRGAIVYWRRISGSAVVGWGHIAPSFGGGFCGSTDWPTGRYGRVNIFTLAQAWGYTEIWWAPVVNDVRVWSKNRPEKPTPLIDRFFAADDADERDRILRRLAENGDGDRPEQVKRAAQRILNGRADTIRARELRERAERRVSGGRQALRGLRAD